MKRYNICQKCKYWDKCLPYRDKNIKLRRMIEIYRMPDAVGEQVIYVSKCSKFKLENQEIPKKKISDL